MTRRRAALLFLALTAFTASFARAQDDAQQSDDAGAPQVPPPPPTQTEAAPPPADAPPPPDVIGPAKVGGGSAGVVFAPADVPSRRGKGSKPGPAPEAVGAASETQGTTASSGATKACPDGPSYDSSPAAKFDFSKTTIMNSPSDVAGWPVDATITKLDINADGFHVDFTKRDGQGRWTDVRTPGWGGDLEYTLWMVESIDGQWYASGPIEYWNGLDRSGGAPSRVYDNWFYAADRWGPMACHQPRVGEKVGFLVTHGDARNGGNGSRPSKERSNVVFVPYPSDEGGVYSFGGN